MLYKLRKLAWKAEPCQNCLVKAGKVVANIVHRQAQDVDPEVGGLLGDPAGCQLWQKNRMRVRLAGTTAVSLDEKLIPMGISGFVVAGCLCPQLVGLPFDVA